MKEKFLGYLSVADLLPDLSHTISNVDLNAGAIVVLN